MTRPDRPSSRRPLKDLVRGAGRRELPLLVLPLLASGALWAFVELADGVLRGETRSFDERILLAMRSAGDPADPIGPPWIEELARDMTALGGVGVLTMLAVVVAGLLLIQRKGRTAILLAMAVGGGVLASALLKHGFSRPRPDLVPHGSYVYTSSFPSGHSMMAAVTYLTLGALLARSQPGRRVKAYLLSIAVLITVLVGVSRVYLGVHWPTDVLAGWTIGAAWASLAWFAARVLQRRGQVESDREGPIASFDPT